MKWHPKGLYALFIPFCPNARPAPPTYEDMFAKREMRVIRFFLQEKLLQPPGRPPFWARGSN